MDSPLAILIMYNAEFHGYVCGHAGGVYLEAHAKSSGNVAVHYCDSYDPS